MSKARENTWQFILAVLGVSLVMLIGFTVFGLTGWGLSFIWETIQPRDYLPMGMFFYIGLGVLWWMLWLAYKFYKWFTSKTFKLVKEKYENGGSLEECSIFEYCDDPQNK
jgi:hypothetical protein